MMKQSQPFGKNQKQGKFRMFLAGYLDLVAKGVILLFFMGLPLYLLFVTYLGLHFLIFFLIYTLCIFAISPYLKKFEFGTFFLEYFERWGKKIEKQT